MYIPIKSNFIYVVKWGFTGVNLTYFAPKHILLVLVRTALTRRLERLPTNYVLSKNKKKYQEFSTEKFHFIQFYTYFIYLCILHGCVFVKLMVLQNDVTGKIVP